MQLSGIGLPLRDKTSSTCNFLCPQLSFFTLQPSSVLIVTLQCFCQCVLHLLVSCEVFPSPFLKIQSQCCDLDRLFSCYFFLVLEQQYVADPFLIPSVLLCEIFELCRVSISRFLCCPFIQKLSEDSSAFLRTSYPILTSWAYATWA